MTSASVGRFAPSATGRAHPGTLVAALLCWLDQRSLGGRVVLRLEDLDPQRCRPELTAALRDDLAWFGLNWDVEVQQSAAADRHAAALERLVATGRVYPCSCSRRTIQQRGLQGGYDNHCRGAPLPAAGWRTSELPLRLDCSDLEPVERIDEAGRSCSAPAGAGGDPIIRRRDGAIAYHLAAVVDDAAEGVTRVVRGADLLASTAPQIVLQRLLGLTEPVYRHHLLVLEPGSEARKLAKFHGAVAVPELQAVYSPTELCGLLAGLIGLGNGAPCRPQDLIADFTWDRVTATDQTLAWNGQQLERVP